MRRESVKNSVCSLCSAPTHQHKLIMASLAKKLKKLSYQNIFPHNQEQTLFQDDQGFGRLINALQLKKQVKKTFYLPCLHHFWLKRFKKFIECSSKHLDYLCHLAANIVSEKSYHFFLLQTQIKNCMFTSCNLAYNTQPYVSAIKIQEDKQKKDGYLKFQVDEVKQRGQDELKVEQVNTHPSFSTMQDYGSLVFDSAHGVWYQAPFYADKQ